MSSSIIIRDLCKVGTANVAYCCIAAVLRGEPARQEQLIGRGPEHSIDKIHFIYNSIQSNSIAVGISMTFATVIQLSEAVLGACSLLHMSESTPLQNTDGAADIVVQEP